jgi:hypothetical protein
MIATEFCSTKLTLPPDALRPTDPDGDPLPDNYWDRSIIVDPDGHQIPAGSVGFDYQLPEELSMPIQCTLAEHEIDCEVLSGTYEIQAWAESYICECWGAQLHMRMVLGKEARTEEKVYDAATGAPIDFVPGMEANITVVDIYPAGVGSSNADCRGYLPREIFIGGSPTLGPCVDDGEQGPFNPGRGFWQQSLLVDVNNGGWKLSDLRRVVPPLTDETCENISWPASSECAAACSPGPFTGAVYAPATWSLGLGAVGAFNQFTFLGADGNFHHADLTKLVGFHLARVTAVTPDGLVCGVQLVGNDGGVDLCGGDCKPVGYGTVFNSAKGTRGLAPGQSFDPSTLAQGGFSVGELVIVTGAGGSAEPFGLAQSGLIVQPIGDAALGFDPLSAWADETFRCPTGQSIEGALEGYIDALSRRHILGAGGAPVFSPLTATIGCVNGRTVLEFQS